MGAVLPGGLLVAAEPQPRLVDERRGLERLVAGFPGHLGRGQLAQLVINQGQEFVGRLRIALLKALQHDGDVVHTGELSGRVEK